MEEEVQKLKRMLLERENFIIDLQKANEELRYQLQKFMKEYKVKNTDVENLLIQRASPSILLDVNTFSIVKFVSDNDE